MGFVSDMHRKYEKEWQDMLEEPFLEETAAGTIPDARFAHWLKQDFLFVREAIPVLALMIPKAPVSERKPLSDAISGLHEEIGLFESMAAEHGVELADVEPEPTNLGYINFMLATGALEPYELCYTVLYTAEKAYLDSWMKVKRDQKDESGWQRFIDNWTSDGFQQWVSQLADNLDHLAESVSPSLIGRMERKFLETLRYEKLFWKLAYSGESW